MNKKIENARELLKQKLKEKREKDLKQGKNTVEVDSSEEDNVIKREIDID